MEAKEYKNNITEGVIWKQLLLFFFPLLFGTFFQQLYNTVDAVVVGQFVGKEALAEVGGASAMIINIFVGFFVGISAGATVTISQFFGGKRMKEVREAIHTAIALAIAGGIIIMVIGMILAPSVLTLMKTPEETMEGSVLYLRIYFLRNDRKFDLQYRLRYFESHGRLQKTAVFSDCQLSCERCS